jgi:hypothetical protein
MKRIFSQAQHMGKTIHMLDNLCRVTWLKSLGRHLKGEVEDESKEVGNTWYE